MLVSIFRLIHSTKGDDKAGGCITKRFHRKRIEWNTFDTPPPMRWPKCIFAPSFPISSFSGWIATFTTNLRGLRAMEPGYDSDSFRIPGEGERERMNLWEWIPSISGVNYALASMFHRVSFGTIGTREKVFWFRISCIFLNARNGSRLERLTFFLISYSFRLNECKYIMRAKG